MESTFYDLADRSPVETLVMQHAALAADHRLLDTLDLLADPILIVNDHRHIIAANRAACWLLNRPADALLGLRLGEAISCEHAQGQPAGCGTTRHCAVCGAARAMRHTNERRTPAVEACRLTQQRDGSPRALDLRVTTTPTWVTPYPFTVVTLRDVSDEERRHVLERLFFHDLLNASGGLSGLLQVLPDLDPADWQGTVEQASQLAQELVHDIQTHRDLTLAERGDLVPIVAPVRVTEVLDRLVATYRHHSVAAGKRIVVDGRTESTVETDAALLLRVLGNLLKNALEATPNGGRVTIRYEDTSRTFAVANATSMPDHVQLSVFQRSFSTKAAAGRGLGAYGAKLLMERYLGGTIRFESGPDLGTVFRATLPAAEYAVNPGL